MAGWMPAVPGFVGTVGEGCLGVGFGERERVFLGICLCSWFDVVLVKVLGGVGRLFG